MHSPGVTRGEGRNCERCRRPLGSCRRADALYCSDRCCVQAARHRRRRELDFLFRIDDDCAEAAQAVLAAALVT